MKMLKSVAVRRFAALLVGSAIATVAIGDRATAQAQDLVQVPTAPSRTAPAAQMGSMTEVDQTFIEMMIPHHQGANEMAQMALERADSQEVKALAQSIIDEQTQEIEQMQSWYRQWYGRDVPMMSMTHTMPQGTMPMPMQSGMDRSMMLSMMQQEMMDREMMMALETAEDFDAEFLRQMTRHHQMATMMAGMVVNSAAHPETRDLARSIIDSQTAEIAQMQEMLSQMASR